ncbi:hypothetical protein DNTS_033407, partial [Danionella cerebrum]
EAFQEHLDGGCPSKFKYRTPKCKTLMDSQSSEGSSEPWSSGTHSPAPSQSPKMSFQYCKRPKKGMATAKQRLSKILKLGRHKAFFV